MIKYLLLLGLICMVCNSNEGLALPFCWEEVCPGVGRDVRIRADAIDTDGVPRYNLFLVEANFRFNQSRIRNWRKDEVSYY